jgi:hypothetical protein
MTHEPGIVSASRDGHCAGTPHAAVFSAPPQECIHSLNRPRPRGAGMRSSASQCMRRCSPRRALPAARHRLVRSCRAVTRGTGRAGLRHGGLHAAAARERPARRQGLAPLCGRAGAAPPPPAPVTQTLPCANARLLHLAGLPLQGLHSRAKSRTLAEQVPSVSDTNRAGSQRLSQTGGPALTLAASWVGQDCAEAGTLQRVKV